MKCLTNIFWLWVTSISLTGQNHYILESLKATKDKESVILTWTVKKGNTCEGVGILRSTDLLHYEQIGKISGICGSTESAQSYFYLDEAPIKNKTNYYVLELGFSGKTDPPVFVEIIGLEIHSSKIIPNPAYGITKIYFNNPNNEKYRLTVYDDTGKFLVEEHSTEDYFIFNLFPDQEFGSVSNTLHTNKYIYIINDKNNIKISSGIILGCKN